ncbi:MAG TPA: hypothetical protein VKT29_14840, partial [Terriglobales bacterium]|nr:hypothetical protein [Terriglobales bacterium]
SYIVFRHLVEQISPDTGKQLDASLSQVASLVGSWGDRQQIATAAENAAGVADQVVQQLHHQQYDRALALRTMSAIAGDSSVAEHGERAAEQAAMALDSLVLAYQQNEKIGNQPELRAAIDHLFQQLNNPSAYNAPMFAVQLQKVRTLLPRGTETANAIR